MLEVKDLSVGDFSQGPLTDINLAVRPGEVAVLIGPSGSGKSLLLEALAGRISFQGTVRIGHYNLRSHADKAKFNLGYLPNPVNLPLHLTALEFLDLVGSAYRMSPLTRLQRTTAIAKPLGFDRFLYTPLSQLSLCQRQLTGVIASVIHEPRVLLLDEPVLGLDLQARRAVGAVVEAERKKDAAVLIATNDLVSAEQVAQRFILLRDGGIFAEGTTKQIANQIGLSRTALDKIYESVFGITKVVCE